jgi:NTP pyrophosphatase (non-canonical NTP hydrolase)
VPTDPLHGLTIEVSAEMSRADARYGPFTSTHEAYGVLAEEMAELLDAIRSNKLESVREEAIQVAAVAMRLAARCHMPTTSFIARSGAA